jgi:uncharacterized integral membrane protein (TIGR00697 family)
MDFKKRKDLVFILLAGFFVTNALVAELIGGKLVQFFGLFTHSIGIILWPIVFLLTDLINEHYGKDGVKKLTYITVGLIIYTFILISIAIKIPAVIFSPVSDVNFESVFGQSQWIIFGSIVAFLTSQLVDVYVFWLFRNKTKGKMIWLRATGSTEVDTTPSAGGRVLEDSGRSIARSDRMMSARSIAKTRRHNAPTCLLAVRRVNRTSALACIRCSVDVVRGE